MSEGIDISASEAMNSEYLFGPYFAGQTWNIWRAVSKAVFGEPMDPAERALFEGVSGGRAPPSRRVREFVAAVGRGGGKDSYASFLAAYLAMTFDPRGKLRPGERAYVLCIACDKEQAAISFGYIKGLFEQIPALALLATIGTTSSIELSNGVTIQVIVNSHRAVRGRSILACIFDEAAFFRSDDSATPDTELYTAVEPGLARVPGSMLCVISSVHKRSGLLYQKIRDYLGKDDPSTLAVMGTTVDFNPGFDQRIVDRALSDNPERAGAEYLSRWRDDLSSFIDRELVEAAVDRGVIARPPDRRVNYLAACDVSGGRVDAFTVAIAHRDETGAAVLDAIFERKPPFNPSLVVAEVAALLRQYGISQITGDNYSQEWAVEAFAKVGIKYVKSERDRSSVYLDTLPLFTSGRVRLLDDRRLITQFSSLERRVFSNGREKVEPGPDHDDKANSVALALTLVGSDGPPKLVRYKEFLVEGRPVPDAISPRYVDFVSMAVGADGRCAIVKWAVHPHLNPRLILTDFETGYFTENRFYFHASDLALCFNGCGQRKVAAVVPDLFYAARDSDVLTDFGFVPTVVRYVEAGVVKLTDLAHQKSCALPLGDALDFRIDRLHDPLPAAALAGIYRGLHGSS